ncbi:MAG: hypothetical protein JXD18_06410 [Anaerolineae bacterium]|nr:hypothetical protein [Anaerolineae bacterium]
MNFIITLIAGLSWAGISMSAFFLWRIARFYETSSGEKAHAWLFVLPMLLLPAGASAYLISEPMFVGFPLGDILMFIGGLVLLLASAILQQVMMGER